MKMLIIPLLIVAVVFASGCTQSSYTQTTNTQAPANTQPPAVSGVAKTFNVNIQNFAFSPANVAIKAGDTVMWTNADSVVHTIVSDSGSEISSSPLANGQTYSHTFNTAGTFTYHCSVHPSMKGTITVG